MIRSIPMEPGEWVVRDSLHKSAVTLSPTLKCCWPSGPRSSTSPENSVPGIIGKMNSSFSYSMHFTSYKFRLQYFTPTRTCKRSFRRAAYTQKRKMGANEMKPHLTKRSGQRNAHKFAVRQRCMTHSVMLIGLDLMTKSATKIANRRNVTPRPAQIAQQ